MRGCLRQAAAAALGFVFGATAAAADPVEISGLDFMVDWPTMVGQTVRITDGRVIGADHQSILLSAKGGSVSLRPEWVDREDLRYLFAHCDGIDTGEDCVMPVTVYLPIQFRSDAKCCGNLDVPECIPPAAGA
jgi:hypothetical protein